MLKRIATALWGKFESGEEIKKFVHLAFIFGLIIATYWGLRPMKDSIFKAIVGKDWLWLAKIVSLIVISPLVVLYSKLIDKFPRHKVFYVLIGIYAVATLGFMMLLSNPGFGLENTVASPHRYLGWAWYVFVESFGSLIVALFWAFTTDITAPGAAKRGFPMIALFGQLGNIAGPYFFNARRLGFSTSAPVVGMLAGLMALTGFIFWLFMKFTPAQELVGYQGEGAHETKTEEKEEEPGFLEGLKLLFSHGYLMGMLFIILLYESIVTVIDYHFKQTVFATFTAEADVAAYLSTYGTSVGIVATLCVLLGVNNIQRYLGMTASLILLPILMAVAILTVWFNPTALTVIMWIMVFSKAINYALNAPTMKQLYIPTTPDTKYKAQAWLEMFGSRGAKAGVQFYNALRGSFGLMLWLTIYSVAGLGLVGVWVMVALYVARVFSKAVKENRVVC